MRFPPPLSAGARVALVAPSGPLRESSELERAEANARTMGWVPVVASHARSSDGYLAGLDTDRAADLNAALADDTVDAIWCLRGGYGAMRLLDAVDYKQMAKRPKAVIGYSDITALHAAFNRHSDVVTFHGPTARQALPGFSQG